MRRALALVTALLTAFTTALSAQGQELVGLFKEVDGVVVYAHAGRLARTNALRAPDGLRGFGLELLIQLSPMSTTGKWSFELGLGYEHVVWGSGPPGVAIDLRGAIRTLPRLSVYAAPPGSGALHPYFGLGTGLVQLRTVRAFDAGGTQYALEGDTFEFGLLAGVSHQTGFFIEAAYRDCDFRSVDYKFPAGVTAVPPGWPRALNLTGFHLSAGFQFGRPGGAKAPVRKTDGAKP